MIEAVFKDEGTVAVDNEEHTISVIIEETEWLQDLTKTVGKGSSEQVEVLDIIICLVM